MKKIRMVATTTIVLAGLLTVLSGTASAQPDPAVLAEDVQIIAGNLPAAVEAAAAGLQEAAATAQETQSAVETSAALGDTVVATGSTLVDGTTQFGALGLGLTLMNLGFQEAVRPVTEDIIDNQDPQAVLDPAHLQTLADNLPTMLDSIQNGSPGGCFPQGGMATGLAHLLQGNVIDPPLGIGPAFWCYSVVNPLLAGFTATEGTPFVGAFQFLGISSLVVGAAAEPEFTNTIEPGLAPVFEGLAPVTGPVIDALEGV